MIIDTLSIDQPSTLQFVSWTHHYNCSSRCFAAQYS